MSKFIEKLKNLSRGERQPMGFGIRKPVSSLAKMQMVVVLTSESDAGNAVGADAVILRVPEKSAAGSLKTISEALPGIPAGIKPDSNAGAVSEKTGKSDFDFLVFPAEGTPLSIIGNSEISRIIEVDAALADGLTRTINDLPVDAVLVSGEEGEFLTWKQLMTFQRVAGLVNKPLLVSLPEKISGPELLALWEGGISAVVIEACDEAAMLRQEIDKLEFPSQRRREKSEAILPRTVRDTGTVDMDEDDDEDDY